MTAIFVFSAFSGISVFWIYTLFIRPILSILRNYQNHRINQEQGKHIQGRIAESVRIGGERRRTRFMNILVEFPNLSGTLITERFNFSDTKPELNRYTEGNNLPLLLNENASSGSGITLADGKASINWIVISGLLALPGAALYALFHFVASPLWLKAGGNWSALVAFFNVPDAAHIALFGGGSVLLVFFVMKKLKRSAAGGVARHFKLYCKKATAAITGLSRTGMMINDNPQVEFKFEFTTDRGLKAMGSDREIIDQLDTGKIHDVKEREILYLPEDPSQSIFLEKISDSARDSAFFFTLISYLVAFSFSAMFFGITLFGVFSNAA